MAATRLTVGAISVSNSSHLPAIAGSWLMKPVIFPPGETGLQRSPPRQGRKRTQIRSGSSASPAGMQRSAGFRAQELHPGAGRATLSPKSACGQHCRHPNEHPCASCCRRSSPSPQGPARIPRGRSLLQDRFHRTPSERRRACGGLLRPCNQRPTRCRAAKKRDEVAASFICTHSPVEKVRTPFARMLPV